MIYLSEDYKSVVNEYFDITDNKTRKIVMNVNEADQSTLLMNLTQKLYQNIVDKITDVDFGSIPKSQGDITKVENFVQVKECLATINNLLIEYKQDVTPTVIIQTAIANIQNRRDMFERAFKLDIEMPMVMYNTMVLSVISSVSFLISTCIEYIKDVNQDNFKMILDKTGLVKTKNNLLFQNLEKFNKSCAKGDFDKSMDYVFKLSQKGFIGDPLLITSIAALTILSLMIIPMLRELIYFFYYCRVSLSDYFDLQAELLQMNIYTLENKQEIDSKKKKQIVEKQSKIMNFFRSIATKLAIKSKDSENKAQKEIKNTKETYKADDVTENIPDSVSSLF